MNRQDAKDAKLTEPTDRDDFLARHVVDSVLAVHRALGPGLLESIYEQCLTYELESCGITVNRQVAMPVVYREIRMDVGFRMDMVVGGQVVVETKAVERLLPIHDAQLLTYLRLSGLRVGLLINFNVTLIKSGIRRLVSTV